MKWWIIHDAFIDFFCLGNNMKTWSMRCRLNSNTFTAILKRMIMTIILFCRLSIDPNHKTNVSAAWLSSKWIQIRSLLVDQTRTHLKIPLITCPIHTAKQISMCRRAFPTLALNRVQLEQTYILSRHFRPERWRGTALFLLCWAELILESQGRFEHAAILVKRLLAVGVVESKWSDIVSVFTETVLVGVEGTTDGCLRKVHFRFI